MSEKWNTSDGPTLFRSNNGTASAPRGRRRSLILPTFLADESGKELYRGMDEERAQKVILKWADLDAKGHLATRKERSLDADFLLEVFGDALGYSAQPDSPEEWNLEREFTVPGAGTADGALGIFSSDGTKSPIAVIELKGAGADLDRDKFNGRTAVQQCWDYLNVLPNCPWGIVSNFITFRLYHREKTPLAYEEFTLQEMRDAKRFRAFHCLFARGGLLRSVLGQPPRAMRLLHETGERQREVGDELYASYSSNRQAMIAHLIDKHDRSLEEAISIAQKLLDRIIFVAFCEDRGLLPAKIIERTYKELPLYKKATNPRWRNFLGLFRAVDEGDDTLSLNRGYNGGLFQHDPAVDNLELDDEWTSFFREVGGYDFRDEVTVEVLGHLFEKSITELEKLRQGGLFNDGKVAPLSRMQKSAKRKRFGIFYTPPEFTNFIVRSTVEAVIQSRFDTLSEQYGVDPNADATGQNPKKLSEYWGACFDALRDIKVCDPACGSGAFLIQAYEVLEEHYHTVINGMGGRDPEEVERLADRVSEVILSDNLFGVDLSPEAVEITQLALWIRSARPGKTLADLSKNILVGNSLVSDSDVDARAMDWRETFPAVFGREEAGFDCVIGNPPWERLKLQEREFFSYSAPQIAEAVSAAKRRELVAQLEKSDPSLFERYTSAKLSAEGILSHVRSSGEFPLTAKGDINTYMLFAELARKLVAPRGRVGLLVPSGIATDHTTRVFFGELVSSKALMTLYDFENKAPVFPDVHRSFKFSTLVFGGSEIQTKSADFMFFAWHMSDAGERWRHIPLNAKDFALLNPNTRTCPIFRTKRDAELTKAIYRRVPILVDESRSEAGNPWGIRFLRMFDQTNDAELFHTDDQLKKKGLKLHGNRWVRGKQVYLPLYEAKMIQAYDHRAASVVIETENWMRQGQTDSTSLVAHQNSDFTAQPRWWVKQSVVSDALGGEGTNGYLCFKDVTSATNERTMIAAFVPHVGMLNSAPVVFTGDDVSRRQACCLLANLNSFVLDYVARQKVGGVHLNFFIVNQLPILPPDAYDEKCSWHGKQRLERWISERVLKLTCTAEDMTPLAEACGFKAGIQKWRPDERARLLAELDAAYFHLYGLKRDEIEYVMSTFSGTRRRDEEDTGSYRTSDLILIAFDELSRA